MWLLTILPEGKNDKHVNKKWLRNELSRVRNLTGPFDYYAAIHEVHGVRHIHIAINSLAAAQNIQCGEKRKLLCIDDDLRAIEKYCSDKSAIIIKSRHWPA